MKRIVQHARSLGDVVAGAVRRVVDPPLTADARPLDIKRAIVEAVEQRVEPAGGGRRVLPGDRVQVTVLAESAEQRRAVAAVLVDVEDAIRSRLLELQCQVSKPFSVDVGFVRRLPDDWDADQRLAVVVSNGDEAATTARRIRQIPSGAHRDEDVAEVPSLTMEVVRGQALKRQFTFRAGVIRIGRSPDLTDDRGRPRLNDVAFLENDNAENRTVTRGHAVIRFDARAGEYRIFDEGSANGTRIVRSGESIDVPKRDPVGVSLRSGDEVHLGKAAVRIRIDS